jgi:hypothetical protein
MVDVLLVASVGLAINWVSSDWSNWLAWVVLGLFVIAGGALAYWQANRAPRQLNPNDLADEAAFRGSASEWLVVELDPAWVLEQVRQVLLHAALTTKVDALAALKEAEQAHSWWQENFAAEKAQWKQRFAAGDDEKQPAVRWVEAILEAAVKRMPPPAEFLDALRALPPGEAAHALVAGYYRCFGKLDRWAFMYLDLLQLLGEKEALMPLLEERLRDPSITTLAAKASLEVAEDALGPNAYRTWRAALDIKLAKDRQKRARQEEQRREREDL